MKKRIISGLAALALTFSGAGTALANITDLHFEVAASAAKIADSGTCGENVTWTFDDEGTLTFSGTGEMTDYTFSYNWSSDKSAPWSHNDNVKKIIIGDGITHISDYAFMECNNLTTVIIPDSVTSIGKWAFEDCASLNDITIPDGVTSINPYTFQNCESLANIIIPNGITYIGESAFDNTAWLKAQRKKDPLVIVNNILIDGETARGNVTIPDSVTSISELAFMNCNTITSVIIPDSITSIGESTFDCCHKLESVTIPDSVTSIGSSAFIGCIRLKSIIIPDRVTSIGDHAFFECNSLKNITIPKSVTSIGKNALGYFWGDNWGDPIEGFSINGYKGTAAETYANENGIKFFDIDSYPSVKSEVRGDRFRLKWTSVPNAENYGLAMYQAGKWRTKAIFEGNVTTCTSPKMNKGTYKMVVCAKVNGEWDTSNFSKRIIRVTVK